MIVAEEVLNNCNAWLAIFIRERDCKTVEEIAVAVDHFLEAHRQNNLLHFRENKD